MRYRNGQAQEPAPTEILFFWKIPNEKRRQVSVVIDTYPRVASKPMKNADINKIGQCSVTTNNLVIIVCERKIMCKLDNVQP
ncbi:MAG: hypothetical protein D3923_17465 [Candidatus Electrothrix sp. AR3]|nr:hypothetical protein [Candidatus Electrothrix sp. AR3]